MEDSHLLSNKYIKYPGWFRVQSGCMSKHFEFVNSEIVKSSDLRYW